jgi:hypothetical protein
VSSWALFVNKPSDITGNPSDDEGYILPELDIRWHEIPTDHSIPVIGKNGQYTMFRSEALGLEQSAKEKRDSLGDRIAKMMELRAENPDAHRIIWHDLEAERHAIDKAIPGITSIYGSQDYEKRKRTFSTSLMARFRNFRPNLSLPVQVVIFSVIAAGLSIWASVTSLTTLFNLYTAYSDFCKQIPFVLI